MTAIATETTTTGNTTAARDRAAARLATTARILLGIVLAGSGLNGLLGLFPLPPMPGAAGVAWHGLQQTGYFFPLLKVVELGAGLLLLRNRLVPLALLLAVPVAVNVAGFHLAVAPQGLPVAALLLACLAVLAWQHRAAFRPLMAARAPSPGTAAAIAGRALGAVFVASAAVGALGQTPPPSTAGAAVMMDGLAAARYFFPLLIGTQAVAGALLLAGRFAPLALVALAPVTVEILAYRLYVATPGMLVVGAALTAAHAWLAWAYRPAFAPLFAAAPGGGRATWRRS